MEESKPKSIYNYGAEYGLFMGAYLSTVALCFMLSLRWTVVSLAVYPLLAGVPMMLWWMLMRLYRTEPIYRAHSALWMFGICVFFFGSLICGAVTAAYMYFIEPQFFIDYATMTIEFIKSGPLAEQYSAEADLLQRAIDKHELPTPINFVVSMMWVTVFVGSVTSMFLAPLVRRFGQHRFGSNNLQN